MMPEADAPARKRPKRVAPFVETHELTYGVRAVDRDPVSGVVSCVACMFCAAFGREDDPNTQLRQRARTRRSKFWRGPCFRTDNYKSHLKAQHPLRWTQYLQMSTEEKQNLFNWVQVVLDPVKTSRKAQQQQRKVELTSVDKMETIVRNSSSPRVVDIASSVEPEPIVEPPVDEHLEETLSEDLGVSDSDILVAAGSCAVADDADAALFTADSGSLIDEGLSCSAAPQHYAAAASPPKQGEHCVQRAFLLDRDVVDVVLKDFFLKEEDGERRSRIIGRSFASTLDERDASDLQRSDGTAEYRAVVQSVDLFQQAVTLLGAGLTFKQVAGICESKEQLHNEHDDDENMMRAATIAISANLQVISKLMHQSWAFSLSLHPVNRGRLDENENRQFLDVRLRLHRSGNMESFHLLALPVGVDRSQTAHFDTIANFLGALCKRWRQRIIGCWTEMSGSVKVNNAALLVVQRLNEQAVAGFVSTSNARMQLDTLLHRFVDSFIYADGAEWHLQLTALSAYLQRQINVGNAQELSAAGVLPCPSVSSVSWWNVVEVTRWFDSARIPILQLLARTKASIAPTSTWWLGLKFALVVGTEALKTRDRLQGGYSSLVTQQRDQITALRLGLAINMAIEGPLPEYQRPALLEQRISADVIGSSDGTFSIKRQSVMIFLRGLGSWSAELLDGLNSESREHVVVSVAHRMLGLIQGLYSLAEELDAHSSTCRTNLNTFPPVLPHQLAQLHPAGLQDILRTHNERMIESFSDAQRAAIEAQHHDLRTAATNEAIVHQLLEDSAASSGSNFRDAWAVQRSRWPMLEEFCGGLATAFPSPSDYLSPASTPSTIPHTLSDFNVEARLQCQQFAQLQAVNV